MNVVKYTCCFLLICIGVSFAWLTYINQTYPELPPSLLTVAGTLLATAVGKDFIGKKEKGPGNE